MVRRRRRNARKIRRLLKLADLLEEVPEEQFRMDVWAVRQHGTKCASAACALGWATTLWPKSLKLVPLSYDVNRARVVHARSGYMEFEAAVEHFGISVYEAQLLFGPTQRSATKEARVLRRFVEGVL